MYEHASDDMEILSSELEKKGEEAIGLFMLDLLAFYQALALFLVGRS